MPKNASALLVCSLLLLDSGVAAAQIQPVPDKRPDRARRFELATPQPANSIQVEMRYKKEYGYKYDSGVFSGSGPTSCGAFYIAAKPDPAIRQENLYGIHNPDRMQESNDFYVCDFLITDLPVNAPISVSVGMSDRRTAPLEAWKGGSQAQPPPGQERTIIIVGGRASPLVRMDGGVSAPSGRGQAQAGPTIVTLTQTQPRARLVYEMVYAPLAGAVRPIDKFDARSARDNVYASTIKTDADALQYQELRCRGGAGLRFVEVEGRTNSSGQQTKYMTVYFKPAAQSAATGLNLQPGQCAFPDRALRVDEPYEIILEVVNFAQTQQQLHGTPVDTSPTAAERYPDAQNIPQYLADASHDWSFFVRQNAPLPSGRFEAPDAGRYWKPPLSGQDIVRPIDSKRTNKDNPYVLTPKKR